MSESGEGNRDSVSEHTVVTEYAEELLDTPRAHLVLELSQDGEGLKLAYRDGLLVECRLTRQGMAAGAYMAQGAGGQDTRAGGDGACPGLHGRAVPRDVDSEPRLRRGGVYGGAGAPAGRGGDAARWRVRALNGPARRRPRGTSDPPSNCFCVIYTCAAGDGFPPSRERQPFTGSFDWIGGAAV